MRRYRQLSTGTLVLCFLGLLALSCAGRIDGGSRQKLKVEKHLRRLNKPPVKTIEVSLYFHGGVSSFFFSPSSVWPPRTW